MLRIQYTDPEISSLGIADITPYLKDTGWQLIKREPFFVFEGSKDDDNNPIQIVLPRGHDLDDIHRRIAETISLLSAIENRSPYEVIRSIKGLNKDIVFFKPKTNDIPLEKAASYIRKIRQFFNYGASVEAEPRKSFTKSTKEGREFVEKSCFLGHTIKGSFGFTIETTLLPRSQITLYGEKETQVPPFERRVIERLARGIKYAQESVMEGNPDILINSYEIGLNANMCDALSDIIEEFNNIETEFYISWSHSYEPDEKLKDIRVILDSKTQNYLNSASKSLSGASESENVTLFGKIIELKRPYDSNGDDVPEGENHIVIRDESEKNVSILLDEIDYKNACDAHRDKKNVSIQGTLEKKGKFWVLRGSYNFKIINDY